MKIQKKSDRELDEDIKILKNAVKLSRKAMDDLGNRFWHCKSSIARMHDAIHKNLTEKGFRKARQCPAYSVQKYGVSTVSYRCDGREARPYCNSPERLYLRACSQCHLTDEEIRIKMMIKIGDRKRIRVLKC